MNKSLKILLASFVCFTQSVLAQSAFQGFYGQIATGYENNSVSNTSLTMNNSSNFPGGNNNPSKGSAPLILGAGYNHSVSQNLLLGLGLDYSFLETTVGTANINGSNSATGSTYKVSNRLNIFLAPGYVIDKDKLAYAKVGYSMQKVKASYYDVDGPTWCSGNSMGSGNAQGFLVGLGYKQIISDGFYGFTEANYYSYGRTSMGTSTLCDTTLITNFSPSTSAYNFLAGIGYKF